MLANSRRPPLPIWSSTFCALFVAAAVGACSGATANLELEAAARTLDEARAQKADDCAKGLYQAAETALAAARQLEAAGEADAAKRKANEAKNYADQAIAASPPGCDEEDVAQAPPPPPPPVETIRRDFSLELKDAVEQPIYFDYNDASIRDDSKETLTSVAELLLNAPGQRIEIEGHCDVRGSTDYNLHLGERRAQAVKRYLVKQGVAPDQLSTISYGEERPVDFGGSEAAHQRNRRAVLSPL